MTWSPHSGDGANATAARAATRNSVLIDLK
jgi:hypothetical protein